MAKIDVSKLTREQKLQLFSLLEEKKRRQVANTVKFEPFEGQLRVIMSAALERYLFCGNGFGKSTILVNEVDWAATGFNPYTKKTSPVPAKMCLLLDSPEKIEDFITEYRKWNPLLPEQLHKRGKPHVSFITWPNGSSLTIITHQVEPLKLEGSQWTHIFMDEPPPKQVFTALFRGGRIKGRPCRVLLAGTPVTAAWLRTDIFEPWARGELEDVEVFRGSTDENSKNLDEGWFKRFFGKLSDHEKAIRRKGEFHDLEGLALAHLFEETVHVLRADKFKWDITNPCVVALDPHPSKKHVAVMVGVDRDNRLYVVKEIAEKQTARVFARTLAEWFFDASIMDVICDSLGSAEGTGGEGFKSFIDVVNEEWKLLGIPHRMRSTTFTEKDDEAWIDRIQDSLLIPEEPDNFGQFIPKLRFLEHCTMSISDVRNVQWARDRRNEQNKPKLDIGNKDALACIKYALATNIFFLKPRNSKPHYVSRSMYGMGPRVPENGRMSTSNRYTRRFARRGRLSGVKPRGDS